MFAIVVSQNCYLYESPGHPGGCRGKDASDEIFSGWAVRLVPEEGGTPVPSGWARVVTHYQYNGYVSMACLRIIAKEELDRRQDRTVFCAIRSGSADILESPKVQGELLETLLRGSIVERLSEEGAETAEGWTLVRTAAGTKGYVHSAFLEQRPDDDAFLLQEGAPAFSGLIREAGENPEGIFNLKARKILAAGQEERLRRVLTETALSYMGTPYRWAGKSSLGIDCSGLMFMCYRQIGILIYRDAQIREEYPVRRISREQLRPGDLLFFEGHVAMSLGGDTFIHSTGFAGSPCVTINSLDPERPDYRPDLPKKLICCGSIFENVH